MGASPVENLREHYDKTAVWWVKRECRRVVRRQMEVFLRHLPSCQEIAVDLGCGTGVYTTCLSGFRMTIGLDFSWQMLFLAHQMCNSRFAWCQSDAMALPLGDRSVDLVISSGLVEHIPNLAGLLRELHRVTQPDGIVAVSFLNRKSVWRRFGSWRFPGGLIYHDAAEVKRLANDAGLQLIAVQYLSVAGPFTSRLLSIVDRLEPFLPFLCQRFILTFKSAQSR